ncbi:hypothetical protein EW15_0419 [Prochlorococcus sp. MIT 0801]|nr:hypothetical protein EW15_0419 [Prochlorococcus sp. MIT 0801]
MILRNTTSKITKKNPEKSGFFLFQLEIKNLINKKNILNKKYFYLIYPFSEVK